MKLHNITTKDNEKPKEYYLKDIDISDKEFILPYPPNSILNQYTTPTCVSHATAAACMCAVYMKTNKRVMLSPYSMHGYFNSKGGGANQWYFAELLCRWGILPKSVFTHTGNNPKLHDKFLEFYKNTPDADKIASRVRAKGWAKLRFADEIKTALKLKYPVLISYSISKSFGKVNGGIEPRYPTKTTGKHALMVRGWTTIDGEEYFVIVNSYGERNGNKGIVYVPVKRAFHDATLLDIDTDIKPKCGNMELFIGSNMIRVDGEIKRNDAYPYINNNRTYMPVRFVAENLGADVEWNEETRTAHIISEEADIYVCADSKTITIDGKKVKMDTAPEILNDRMMLPIRFIAEALNCSVKWDENAQKVTIISL